MVRTLQFTTVKKIAVLVLGGTVLWQVGGAPRPTERYCIRARDSASGRRDGRQRDVPH